METHFQKVTKFDTEKSVKRARATREKRAGWIIKVSGGEYAWANKMERVDIIRRGLPKELIFP